MSDPSIALHEDYLSLLRDPTALEELGLVRDRATIQPVRPYAGKVTKSTLALLHLESILGAAIDKDKSPALTPDFLRKVLETGGSQQSTLDQYDKELRVGIDRSGVRFPIPYYVADFPLAYPFNAATVRRPAGALVLVNRGLTDVIWFAAKLFAARIAIQIKTDQNDGQHIDRLPFSETQIAEWFAKVIVAYLIKRNAHEAGHLLPIYGRARETVAACLLNECAKFVLAHEFGHILGGHLTSGVSNSRPKDGDPDDIVLKVITHTLTSLETNKSTVRLSGHSTDLLAHYWVREVEADMRGLELLMAGLGSLQGDKHVVIDSDHPLLEFAVVAPFFLFQTYRLIDEVEKARSGHRGRLFLTSHPPAELREEFVRMRYEASGLTKMPRLTTAVREWFGAVEQPVIEAALKLSV